MSDRLQGRNGLVGHYLMMDLGGDAIEGVIEYNPACAESILTV